MIATKKKAPAGQGEGCDQNPYQEELIVMKTTSPILASAPDNEELSRSGDSILVACHESACAYVNHGHWTDIRDPLYMHRYVGVTDPQFHLVIERLSTSVLWELSVELRSEDMSPDQARRFARVLTKVADIADSLNAETA